MLSTDFFLQPTMNEGGTCSSINTNYINKCQYDGAYHALNHIYGGLTSGPDTTTEPVYYSSVCSS